MPTNIKDYSTTQASNTSLNGISTAEGMLPSNLNNAIRALMKNTRDWFNDAQWIEYGDGDGAFTAAYASATSFTIAGVDVTSIYHAGRRIKLTATTPGTIINIVTPSITVAPIGTVPPPSIPLNSLTPTDFAVTPITIDIPTISNAGSINDSSCF